MWIKSSLKHTNSVLFLFGTICDDDVCGECVPTRNLIVYHRYPQTCQNEAVVCLLARCQGMAMLMAVSTFYYG